MENHLIEVYMNWCIDGKFFSLGLFYKLFPRLGLSANYFPGSAVFARTQHASRNWEWRLHAWLIRGERWRDVPISLAISAHVKWEAPILLAPQWKRQYCWRFQPRADNFLAARAAFQHLQMG